MLGSTPTKPRETPITVRAAYTIYGTDVCE